MHCLFIKAASCFRTRFARLLAACPMAASPAMPPHNIINNAVSSVSPVPRVNGSGVISNRNSGSSTTFINNMSNNANRAIAREFDLFELACADDSSIGIIAPKFGVSVCRLTLKTCNLTTKLGFKHALAFV